MKNNTPLIHANEAHLIDLAIINKAVGQLVNDLSLAAGSSRGFDLYTVIGKYITDTHQRHAMNNLLDIEQGYTYYEEEVLDEAEQH